MPPPPPGKIRWASGPAERARHCRGITAALLLVLCAAVPIFHCCKAPERTGKFERGQFEVTGTMHKIPVEQGCWQFTGDDGKKYELSGEGMKDILVEGARARILVRELSDRATICMTGKLVEVISILETIRK